MCWDCVLIPVYLVRAKHPNPISGHYMVNTFVSLKVLIVDCAHWGSSRPLNSFVSLYIRIISTLRSEQEESVFFLWCCLQLNSTNFLWLLLLNRWCKTQSQCHCQLLKIQFQMTRNLICLWANLRTAAIRGVPYAIDRTAQPPYTILRSQRRHHLFAWLNCPPYAY